MSDADKPTSLDEFLRKLADQFEDVKADPAMSFERELEWALQQLYKQTGRNGDNPVFGNRDAAHNNLSALREAFLNVSGIGITLNPARKLSYLLVRDKRIVYDLSYLGLIDVAVTVGAIRWAQAELVYAADTFKRVGIDRAPVHECNPFAEDRGPVVGCYVVAKLLDGDFLTETMTTGKINAIRDRVPGATSKYSPWVNHWEPMAKKTTIKTASKFWKVAGANMERLDRAIHYLNTDGGEGIDFEAHAAAPAPAVTMPKAKAAAPIVEKQLIEKVEDVLEEMVDEVMEDIKTLPAAQQVMPAKESAGDTSAPASAGSIKWLTNQNGKLKPAMAACGIKTLDGLTTDQFAALKAAMRKAA